MMAFQSDYDHKERLRQAIEDIQELIIRRGFMAIKINGSHVLILDDDGEDGGSAMEPNQAIEVLS